MDEERVLLRDQRRVRRSLELADDEQAGLQDFNNAHKKFNLIWEDFQEIYHRTQARGLIAKIATATTNILRSFRPYDLVINKTSQLAEVAAVAVFSENISRQGQRL